MSLVSRWLKNASPLSKTLMAISITTSLVVGHRWFYAPYVRRRRYREAEDWANVILEQEDRMQEQSEGNYGTS